jgi:transposase-like protein
MGNTCQVCRHEQRERLELGLARGVSVRNMAKKFGVSKDSLWRHRRGHMPQALVADLLQRGQPTPIDVEALKKEESESLLSNIVRQRREIYDLLQECRELGDARAAVGCHSQINANLKLAARCLGELQMGGATTVNNLLISPDYVRLRALLLKALRPYPEAVKAVAGALRQVEAEDADAGPRPLLIDPAETVPCS